MVKNCTGGSPSYALDSQHTGQVVSNNGTTSFLYTVENTLASGDSVASITLEVPYGNVLPAMGHSEPSGWSYGFRNSGGGAFSWLASSQQYYIQPGQSVTFDLSTSSSVSTEWDFSPFGGPNRTWVWYNGSLLDDAIGNNSLPIPVPVPEPSSLLVLACGIAGLWTFALKPKRT